MRAYFAYPDLRAPSGHPTGAMYGVANRVREAVERFAPSRVVACWDRGHAAWRTRAFAGYKDRPRSDGAPDLTACFAQRPPLRELLTAMGVDQVEVEGVEADDLVAWHVEREKGWTSDCGDVVILSTDRDFYQLVDARVSVYLGVSAGKGRTVEHVTPGTFRAATSSASLPSGVADPGEWAAYRVVNGDASDRIPGVRGLSGEKRWGKIYPVLVKMGYRGDAQDFFIAQECLGVGGYRDPVELSVRSAVAENWSLLERNCVLQDLRFAVGMLEQQGIDPGKFIEPGTWNERLVERTCAVYNFQSALRNWGSWRDTFRGLYSRRDR